MKIIAVYDDALVIESLRQHGAWELFDKASKEAQGRGETGFMMLVAPKEKEVWFVQEFRGVKNDEGYAMTKIPFPLIHHPMGLECMKILFMTSGITPEKALPALKEMINNPSKSTVFRPQN